MARSVEEYLNLPYKIEVFRDVTDGQPGWVARVAELSGCITQGDSFTELEEMIRDAMRGWIEAALEMGIPIPEPPEWDTWETAEVPSRRCGMPVHLRHRQDKRRQRVVSFLDGRWNCAVCGPYLKKKWLEHLYPIFTEAERIYLTTLPSKKEWGTLYKRLQRIKADFARLELETGELVVLSNQNADGVELPLSIRNGILKVAMDAATFRHKPITTSRGWKLPQKKDDGEESQWERVGGLPITIDEAREVVKELGLKPFDLNLRFVPNALDAFEVVLPESWLEDDEKGFKVFVKWLSNGPVKTRDAPGKEALAMCRV